MRTIPEVCEDIKNILNNIEWTENCDGETLVDIDELVNEILMISTYKPMKETNADRIRAMSDDELAEFLADPEKFSPCKNCDFHFVDAMNDDCKAPDGWICTKGYAAALIHKWLQSEAEE